MEIKLRKVRTVQLMTNPIMHELPTELLIEIFAASALSDGLAPIRISGVCSLWREIAGKSPRIWQVIHLDDTKRPIAASHIQASQFVSKSAPLFFDVNLSVQSPDLILPLLSPCLKAINRWRALTITGRRQDSFLFSNMSLHSLTLSMFSQDEMPENSGFADATGINLWMYHLPRSSSLVPLQFTDVTISEESICAHPQPAVILDFLSACPNLQAFSLTGWIHDDVHSLSRTPVVSLPHLRILRLRSTCTVRALLSHIHAPELSELYLGLLNVDWALPRDGFDMEDGDSDDEANDFSRSPSSDHATGMALRSLIKRSNPPIRVLEMDFADLRTKDFAFVFNRLENLEHFLIVASDMSDTVIHLLKPSATSRIRLPRLRLLTLDSCLRLSGDAVVDALSERVRLTDESNWTLETVTIVGCDLFTNRHGQALRRDLGPRLIY